MTGPDTDLRVSAMTFADVDAVVQLQLDLLPDSLVTQLGRDFLRHFHQRALGDEATLGLVARTAGGELGGFVVGTTDGVRFRAGMRRHVFLPLIRALLSRPSLIRPFALSAVRGEPPSTAVAELLLLAVTAEYRRRRVATGLVSALDGRFLSVGVADYRVAVRSWLAPAVEFYKRLGFEVEAEADVLGKPMTYLRRRIASSSNREGR